VCTHCTILYHNALHCTTLTKLHHTATQISHHTRNGRRVLACAYRACGAAGAGWALEAERREVESHLIWAGLLVMENTLKPDTKDAVDELVGVYGCMCL